MRLLASRPTPRWHRLCARRALLLFATLRSFAREAS
jgi:hypothetical protein